MRILAIETVGSTGSVAALADENLLAEQSLDPRGRSAQTLAPALRELLVRIGWRTNAVQLVAVATGPGSFTGLRIGVTTAKTFAYALGCEVIGVNTLEVIASRAPADVHAVSVVLGAGRGEVFAAEFQRRDDGQFVEISPTRVVNEQEWLHGLKAPRFVSGPVLAELAVKLPADVTALDPAIWSPTAAEIGRVAARLYNQGQRENVFNLAPQYFRRTAAEEQWERRVARER